MLSFKNFINLAEGKLSTGDLANISNAVVKKFYPDAVNRSDVFVSKFDKGEPFVLVGGNSKIIFDKNDENNKKIVEIMRKHDFETLLTMSKKGKLSFKGDDENQYKLSDLEKTSEFGGGGGKGAGVKNTDALESAASIGFLLKPNDIEKIESEIGAILLIKSADLSALDFKVDDKIIKLIKDKIDISSLKDIFLGSSNFVKNYAGGMKPTQVVWSDMKKYYDTMKKLGFAIEGEKQNTADVVVFFKGTLKDLSSLKKVSPEDVTTSNDQSIITIGKIQFSQVSLKKSVEGAFLGKVKTALSGLGAYDLDTDFLLGESIGHPQVIDEGILDIMKRGLDYTRNLIDKTKKFFSKFFSKFKNKLSNLFSKNNVDKELNTIMKKYSMMEGYDAINEGRFNLRDYYRGLVKNLDANFPRLKRDLDAEYEKVESNFKNSKVRASISKINSAIPSNLSAEDKRYIFMMNLLNLASMRVVNKNYNYFVSKNSSLEEFMKKSISLEKSAIMGASKLPIVKIAGNHIEIFSNETFQSKAVSKVKGITEDTIPYYMAIQMNPTTDKKYSKGFYVFYFYILTDIERIENEIVPIYTSIRLRSYGGADNPSLSIEAENSIQLKELNKKIA